MVSSKTNKKKNDVIKFSKMLNDKKLSALRSGNISVRHKNGFLITPSGKKYSSLKVKLWNKHHSFSIIIIRY
jgi:ribulose-5-phosphate 4-epimerase/fuculose-1-phosphate aldolase